MVVRSTRPLISNKEWPTVYFSIFIFFNLLFCASAIFKEYRELKMHGEIYSNSCVSKERQALQEKILKSEARDNYQAWKTVDLILCSEDNSDNRKMVMSLFKNKVRETGESTGGSQIVKTVVKNEEVVAEVMAGGSVWNTDIFIEARKIILQYFLNEACVKSTTLLYANSKWSIYGIGEACD